MSKKYCRACGEGTEYALKEPNCCSNCGKKFSETISIANVDRAIKIEVVEAASVEKDDAPSIPKIDKLEMVFEHQSNVVVVDENFCREGVNGGVEKRPVKKYKKGQVLKEIAAEVASRRNNDIKGL